MAENRPAEAAFENLIGKQPLTDEELAALLNTADYDDRLFAEAAILVLRRVSILVPLLIRFWKAFLGSLRRKNFLDYFQKSILQFSTWHQLLCG